MSKKSVQRAYLLLLLGGLSFIIFLARLWPQSILAQDTTDDPGAGQVFLPYVADGRVTTSPPTVVHTEDDSHTHTHPHPQLESWPPQPEGVSDVIWFAGAPSAEVIAAESAIRAAAQQALASDAVQAALGERFIQATTTYLYDKAALNAATPGSGAKAQDKENAEVRVTYFSYSRNATVEAVVQAGTVTAVRSMAAAIYQPEPTTAEKHHAVALARAYFAGEGFARIQQLEGYVIQAYQTEGVSGFYENRVLYVTFHQSIDERPEFVAWVDLTNETVIKSFQDQYQITPGEDAQ